VGRANYPVCGGQMRIIACLTFSADTHKILDHMGVGAQAARITQPRGPPLWGGCVPHNFLINGFHQRSSPTTLRAYDATK